MVNKARLICVLVLAIATSVILAGCGASGPPPYDQTPEATLDRLVQGMQTESVGLVLSCYTNPYRLTAFGRSVWVTHEDAANAYRQAFARYNYSTWHMYARAIAITNSSATAACDVRVYNGTAWEYVRFLYSMARYGSTWLINHETLLDAFVYSGCVAQVLSGSLSDSP